MVVGTVVAMLPALLPFLLENSPNWSISARCSHSPSYARASGCSACRHPQLQRPFRTPLVPLVPMLGMISAVFLMTRLPRITWLVLGGWLLMGLLIYFGYSIRHSKAQRAEGIIEDEEKASKKSFRAS